MSQGETPSRVSLLSPDGFPVVEDVVVAHAPVGFNLSSSSTNADGHRPPRPLPPWILIQRVHIRQVVPGLENLPRPSRIPSDPPEVVGVHDDHFPPVRLGWVLAPASLVAGGDPVGGAAEEVFVAVAGEGGGHADGVAGGVDLP